MIKDLKVVAQDFILIVCGITLAMMLSGCSMLKAHSDNYQRQINDCKCAPCWGKEFK